MTTNDLEHLTQRLLNWYETESWVVELEALTPLVLSELARGEPVDVARIAARTGMTASDVLGLLRGSPAEWDHDGRLVGYRGAATVEPIREGIVVSVADAFTLTRRLFADGPISEAA
jgi:hypothetical protein